MPANPVFDPQGALAELSNDPIRAMMRQQEEGRRMSMDQLERTRAAANVNPEDQESEVIGAMALAAGRQPAMVGGFGQLLANIGGTAAQTVAKQRQQQLANQIAIGELIGKTAMPFGSGATTAMLQAQLNPFMNVGGVGLVSRRTGELAVPSNMIPEYNKLYQNFYKSAIEQKMENPEDWARQQAMQQLGVAMGTREVAGARATPLPPAPGQPVEAAPTVDLEPGTNTSALIKQLERDEKYAVSQGDYARASELQKARKAIAAQSPAAAPAGGIQYRDIPKSKMEEATAEETGKSLGKTMDDLQTASAASADLKVQLNALRELYKTPNLPEGQLGEQLQSIRSSLKSLGIEVGKEVGAGGMIGAIGGKLALLTRTADGKNLMPGAMSDFEQRILRGLAPGLNQTAEGRAALVEFLSDMADVRIRLASEASKMATSNRGILPPEWYQRRDRVLKEEQARLAVKSRELAKRFQGVK